MSQTNRYLDSFRSSQGSVPPQIIHVLLLGLCLAMSPGYATEADHAALETDQVQLSIAAVVPHGPWRGGHVGTWPPEGPAQGVLLLHHGHSAFDGGTYAPGNLIPVAEAFQAAGFLVYGVEMPPGKHDGLPIEQFVQASQTLLDMIEAMDPHMPVYMVGLSGGGWTTTVMTAIDARITRGYSVAGDHPVESVERGDWEQHIMDYPLLYAMAGDRLRHIYVWGDWCCFGHVTGDIGTPYVIDTSTQDHTISPWAIHWILDDIAQHRVERLGRCCDMDGELPHCPP